MALKTYRPITPSLRQLVTVDRSGLHKGKPVKALTEGLSKKGGRNNHGRVTVRWIGGGASGDPEGRMGLASASKSTRRPSTRTASSSGRRPT